LLHALSSGEGSLANGVAGGTLCYSALLLQYKESGDPFQLPLIEGGQITPNPNPQPTIRNPQSTIRQDKLFNCIFAVYTLNYWFTNRKLSGFPAVINHL